MWSDRAMLNLALAAEVEVWSMPLTDIACRKATCSPGKARKRLADAHGTCLEVMPSGAKYWRLKRAHEGARLPIRPDLALRPPRLRDLARSAGRPLVPRALDDVRRPRVEPSSELRCACAARPNRSRPGQTT